MIYVRRVDMEPIYPDHRVTPQKLQTSSRQNSSSHWKVLTSID